VNYSQAHWPHINTSDSDSIVPIYYFNVHKGEQMHIDKTERELPDDFAAWYEVTTSAELFIRNADGKLPPNGWRTVVFDRDGRILCLFEVKGHE
jgi:hypothetical protein